MEFSLETKVSTILPNKNNSNYVPCQNKSCLGVGGRHLKRVTNILNPQSYREERENYEIIL